MQLHPAEHYYLHSKPVDWLAKDTPVVRDPDGHIYFRENSGKLLAGGFEPIAKPAFEDGNLPKSMKSRLQPVSLENLFILNFFFFSIFTTKAFAQNKITHSIALEALFRNENAKTEPKT